MKLLTIWNWAVWLLIHYCFLSYSYSTILVIGFLMNVAFCVLTVLFIFVSSCLTCCAKPIEERQRRFRYEPNRQDNDGANRQDNDEGNRQFNDEANQAFYDLVNQAFYNRDNPESDNGDDIELSNRAKFGLGESEESELPSILDEPEIQKP